MSEQVAVSLAAITASGAVGLLVGVLLGTWYVRVIVPKLWYRRYNKMKQRKSVWKRVAMAREAEIKELQGE